ncbi:hypothetical protein B0A50_02430 [Salinomyces thailandicus]|uniref:Malate dehydrogenase n=1 Tax=Salinomyces thailandicus TaxID=706561 RepID=A0A4U0U698_9PEZI|nr:hypothetical protein B0A50_02430 [Salinomyces thailandica]
MFAIQPSLLAISLLLSTVYSLPHILTSSKPYTEKLQSKQPLQPGLPANTELTLQYVTLGLGVQNYTCNGQRYIQNEAGDGAHATLYDATHYLGALPTEINTLPPRRLFAYESLHQREQVANVAPHLQVLGEHFFTSALVPTFDLSEAKPPLRLSAAKAAAVPAPTDDAVAWLYLVDRDDGQSDGLKAVYRVETVKGVAPSSCTAEETGSQLAVSYAAEYWFYQ